MKFNEKLGGYDMGCCEL